MNIVKILPTSSNFQMPSKAHLSDAGFDLKSVENVVINPGRRAMVDAGFKMQLPEGFEAQIRPRSGNAIKLGLSVINSPGTVDQGFTGNIKVLLVNLGQEPITINIGDKIAQMVIKEVPQVTLELTDTVDSTDRGEKGFGSSGNN